MRKLREADRLLAEGADVALVCRQPEVSVQTYQRWRSQYRAMRPEDVTGSGHSHHRVLAECRAVRNRSGRGRRQRAVWGVVLGKRASRRSSWSWSSSRRSRCCVSNCMTCGYIRRSFGVVFWSSEGDARSLGP